MKLIHAMFTAMAVAIILLAALIIVQGIDIIMIRHSLQAHGWFQSGANGL
jgi:hypothetical protein